jgi:hypoxanthine phosphoribosyltransferase
MSSDSSRRPVEDQASVEEAQHILATADCLYDRQEVERAFDRMAGEINERLRGRDPLVVCVLMGGLVPFGCLLTRLDFHCSVDYVHATRYRGALRGETLHWLAGPGCDLTGRDVLLVDDILDEGCTLARIEERLLGEGAEQVWKAVLIRKARRRTCPIESDFIGLDVPDRYVFGYGMDYRGYLRNAPGIFALGDS